MTMRFENVKWGYIPTIINEPLNFLKLWGINTIKYLAQSLQLELEQDGDVDIRSAAVNEIERLAEDLGKTLERLNEEACEEAQFLKSTYPDIETKLEQRRTSGEN